MTARRILFVDDRPEVAHQPVARLRMEGYDVDEATSGGEAKAALEERPYDLLVFDADLPGSDGWEVLKWLRSGQPASDMKVLVFMAGKGETGRLMLVSVDAELRRPFSLRALVDAVAKVIGKP